jgi:hypothetical protein
MDDHKIQVPNSGAKPECPHRGVIANPKKDSYSDSTPVGVLSEYEQSERSPLTMWM